MKNKYEDWDIEKLIWYRDKLKSEFDELESKHIEPLRYRHLGCRYIYIDRLIKERKYGKSSDKSKNKETETW